MRRAEGVVFALGAAGEAGKPVFLAQRADAVAPAGQDLVRIALMADIPDQPVIRRVEDVVHGDRQFDHAETGAEMSAGVRHGVDHLGAQFRASCGRSLSSSLRRSAGMGPCRAAAFSAAEFTVLFQPALRIIV